MFEQFWGEVLGTFRLILLGDGVVANVLLKKTKGFEAGWIVITCGWGMAVFVAVLVVAAISGAHINPAVTLGLAIAGKFDWGLIPLYFLAQMIGSMLGALLVYLSYKDHFKSTEDKTTKLAVFSTIPEIRDYSSNFLTETIGTFVLVLGVIYLAAPEVGLGAINALPVGLLVFSIGLSLGGPTGYSINPARDIGPRIMHSILPIPDKGGSDWVYSWVPVFGPFAGGALAALIFIYSLFNKFERRVGLREGTIYHLIP